MVDLPQANVKSAVGVVVHGVGIAAALVGDDAFAAGLIPAVLAAPGGDVLDLPGGAAGAGGALAGGTVATAVLCEGEEYQEYKDEDLHVNKR